MAELTPPRKGSKMSDLSPTEYLTSAEAMSPLKRKAHFKKLSSEALKKFRLDPSPVATDTTITKYHERLQSDMRKDQEKLHVQILFESELEHIQEIKSMVLNLETEIEGLKRLETEIQGLKKARFKMFAANTLVDLTRKMATKYKPDILNDSSTTRLQQFAANLSKSQLQAFGVPTKMWPFLPKLNEFITARNQQAHDTEKEFAKLLLDDYFKESHIFETWKDVFELLYGAKVEEVAVTTEDSDNMLFG